VLTTHWVAQSFGIALPARAFENLEDGTTVRELLEGFSSATCEQVEAVLVLVEAAGLSMGQAFWDCAALTRGWVEQSRRDCITQPRVARHELPWVGDRVGPEP
jgi:hypothetical protein